VTAELPSATIVIPNYNGVHHLDDCLASLRALRYDGSRCQVLLVDNASTDGSAEWTRSHYPEVRVVEADANLGFAGACNLGARQAESAIVAFLNNDMRVDEAWLIELATPFAGEQDVVSTGGKILSWNGKAIDFVGGQVNFYGHGFQPLHGRPASDALDLATRPALFACGGSMAVRRELFLRCGGFDEDYFAFFEDIDFGWRSWVLGYRVLLVPTAVAYHKGHATGSRLPEHQRRVLYERNALTTAIKNYDDENLARVLPASLLLMGKRAQVYGHIEAAPYQVWADAPEETETVRRAGISQVIALAELARDAEKIWAKRAAIQAARTRSDREILPLLETPFQTNCLDEQYMEVQQSVQRVFGLDAVFAPIPVAPRILVISNDTVNERMAGPGIRSWEMARVLSKRQPVTLAVPNDDPLAGEGFDVVGYGSTLGRGLRKLAADHDVLVVQGFVLHLFPFLTEMGKTIVVDLYDPFTLENLHVYSHDPIDERLNTHEAHLGVLNAQIQAGDFFLCASEKQRDYWLGMLAANNRINPPQYDADPTLRGLIDIVPFGIGSEAPIRTGAAVKGVIPGIDEGDRVILWGGGIWEWFDPLTLIRAVARIRETRPEVKLFFMGTRHPNPMVPEMAMTARALELARELDQEGIGVFFNEWVPYEERQNYLLEADVGASLHFDHLETRFSFRTRVLDYIWAGLPIVCTGGDAIGDLVESQGLGRVVDYGDEDGLVEALLAILDHPGGSAGYAARFAAVAADLGWERVLEPLIRFCAEPRAAPDRVAGMGRFQMRMETAGQRERGLQRAGLLAPAPPPTPLLALPFRALTYVRMGGLPRLWQEVRSYLRWLRIRGVQ
jgi:GT2 family glycosyltransferase/glycosyltransferase involved in cell wall biosynthesis